MLESSFWKAFFHDSGPFRILLHSGDPLHLSRYSTENAGKKLYFGYDPEAIRELAHHDSSISTAVFPSAHALHFFKSIHEAHTRIQTHSSKTGLYQIFSSLWNTAVSQEQIERMISFNVHLSDNTIQWRKPAFYFQKWKKIFSEKPDLLEYLCTPSHKAYHLQELAEKFKIHTVYTADRKIVKINENVEISDYIYGYSSLFWIVEMNVL